MGWVSLILQLLTLRKSFQESQSMLESAKLYAEKGKRALSAFLAFAIAGLFFFSGLLTAVLELGLQLERKSVGYSGLMISATILVGLGLVCVLLGILLGRSPAPTPDPLPETNDRAERIKDLLEEFLVTFLSNLAKAPEKKASQEHPKQD